MKKSFGKIHCRDILYRDVVTEHLATILDHGGQKVALHTEFDGFTIRWLNKAEADLYRQWERVCCDGMSFIMLPDKPTAAKVGMELLTAMASGSCLEAAVKLVTRRWMLLTELGDWDAWRMEMRDSWMRRYGKTTKDNKAKANTDRDDVRDDEGDVEE